MASYAPTTPSEGDLIIWQDYLQHASGAARTAKLKELAENLGLCRILPSLFRAFADTDSDISITDMGILFCLFLLCRFADATAPAVLGTYGPVQTFTRGTDLWVVGVARRVAAPTAELIFATCAQRFKNDDILARLGAMLQPLRTDGENNVLARLGERLQTLGTGSEGDGRSLLFGYLSSRYEELLATHSSLGGNSLNSTGTLSDAELRRQSHQIEDLHRALDMIQMERAFDSLRIG
ncbi:hypothetical protein HD806DRAFT_128777 [Xylariaceae sp. AK1471]|nr:hypothetical protein HD806DRAFT_128777 [Xylariaceae sp. AK1471]